MFIFFLSMLKKRFMMPFFVLLLLSGCGQSLSAQNQQKTPVLLHSGSTTPTPTPGPSPLGTSVAFDLGGWLHVQSAGGFKCNYITNGGNPTPGTLVLPTVQPTYDQGTLQSVINYITAANKSRAFVLDTVPYPEFSANSDAFRLAAVTVAPMGCGETLHVTNIGNAPVQISQVSVQLTADTQTNHQHYNLIGLCSLVSSLCFPRGGGEAAFLASFDLHSGKTNTKVPATCWGYAAPACSPQALSLKPGEVAKVVLSYSASDNLSFSLKPTFTLDWPGTGKQTIYPVPQLQATFAFASTSQFSCYALQGQKFIAVPVDFAHYCF